MAYYKHELALVLIWLCVLFNYGVDGTKFVAVEGRNTEAKEGQSTGAHPWGIISNLFTNPTDDDPSDLNIHHAGFLISSSKYTGTRARISTWGIPNVSSKSETAVYIAVVNENTNQAMFTGFHVYPGLYNGSTELRLFAGWVADKSGIICYSTQPDCQVFVPSNITVAPIPGLIVAPLSTYNGKDYFLTLSIKKDDRTQDWSLYRDDDNNPILIGWWPKTLFNNTFDYATKLIWTGRVRYPKNEISPAMGSGHPAAEGPNKAAYISNIKLYDESGHANEVDRFQTEKLTDRLDCFTTHYYEYSRNTDSSFFYGGPAGCNF